MQWVRAPEPPTLPHPSVFREERWGLSVWYQGQDSDPPFHPLLSRKCLNEHHVHLGDALMSQDLPDLVGSDFTRVEFLVAAL